jgi:hypothetical protein
MSESGYSGRPLPKKLGLKPELAALFVDLPDSLAHLPDGHAVDLLVEEGIPGSDHHHRRCAAGDIPADGLVDIKLCAVDEIWSGLKFMLRKELRS